MNRSRLFANQVSLVQVAWSDERGAKVPGPNPPTVAQASVQPIRSNRRVLHEIPAGVAAYSVYLAIDPGLGVDDRVLWNGRTLRVLAAARNQVGRDTVWSLDAVEIEAA